MTSRPVGVKCAKVSPVIQIQMATINNTQLLKGLIEKAKIQLSADQVPTQLAEKIVPVIVAEPEKNIFIADLLVSDSAIKTTIHTCHATKRTFIVGCSLSVSKDAINNSLNTSILASTKGQSENQILIMRYEPTTAGSNMYQEKTFVYPIELEKGSNISMSSSQGTASIDTHATLYLYEVE